MPYPQSPFPEHFDRSLITGLQNGKCDTSVSNEEYESLVKWLCAAPKISSYRVNRNNSTADEVLKFVQDHCSQIIGEPLKVEKHPLLDDVIIIHGKQVSFLERHQKEIIIDVDCASAILRGAHIYGPGVLGMFSGCQIGDFVSIFVDVNKKCKKGFQKLYEDEGKLFIGNGVVKMQRYQLFSENVAQNGVAVEVKETISGCPSIGDDFLPSGTALLQNLPSILCVVCLDPQPGDIVLDMCASPGNKTTHIAELMNNKGTIVAIDKTKNKVKQLEALCEKFGANVNCFEADSTKIVAVDQNSDKIVSNGPPFVPETFNRILLDAPCSVLGKRPQLVNRLSNKEIRSYVPIQRKLFNSAVKLLKPNGTLVYSTCTITFAENEAMVAWALKTFENLKLVKPKIVMGSPGWSGVLSDEDRRHVQRFGPSCDVDSVGFFFACFVKREDGK